MNTKLSEILKYSGLTLPEFLELITNMKVLDRLNTKSLTEAVEEWITEKGIEGKSSKTLDFYREYIKGFISFIDPGTIVHDITPAQIKEYLLSRQKSGRSAYSQHATHRTLSVFFNWCKRQGYCSESPVKIMRPKVPMKVMNILNDADMKAILKACNSNMAKRDKAIFLMFWDTGMRLQELTNIKLEDIDFQGRYIEILGKGQKKRIVHLSQPTTKALWDYLKSRNGKDLYKEIWLTEEGRPMQSSGIQQLVKRISLRALGRPVRPHLFRHTFATMYLESGGDSLDLQYLLGHSSLKMVENYSRATKARRALKAHERLSPVERLGLR